MENTKLSSSHTVGQYREYKKNQNREKIADLIFERFNERYIQPFENNSAKNGFSMMAVASLMIESFYCFQKGRIKASEAGGVVFSTFFAESVYLKEFAGYGAEFYSNVRCGILHQGETYNGWLIHRKGHLFDAKNKIINATKFHEQLKKEILGYTDRLRARQFNETIWRSAIRKLDHICNNCLVYKPASLGPPK